MVLNVRASIFPPGFVSLPSCKSPMFQPAGAGVGLDLSWRENIPFLRSPLLPKAPSRIPDASQVAGVILEVRQASQERHLPVSTVTSGEGAQSSTCTLIPLIRLTSAPLQRASSSLRAVYALCFPTRHHPPDLSIPKPPLHSPRHRRPTTPPAHSQFSLSTSPHLPQNVLSSHNLVPGICPEGAGLLSNLSGPTHPCHMRAVIGES